MTIQQVVVVIPARNEEELITACLRSIVVAARGIPHVSITVAADSCTDRTIAIAEDFATVIDLDARSVGTARRLGVERAISAVRFPLSSVWIANTDADSTVPANWLSHQIDLANSGADAVVGTVRPSAGDLTAAQWTEWHATHDAGQALGHVHGANLGIRASSYLAAGGFPTVDEHEDNDLVHRLRSASFEISASDQCEVVTSGRRMGRTPGGYARYLREGLYTHTPDLV